MLEETHGKNKVHAVDVATSLHFSKPSVSVAMKKLRESGFITLGNANELILTPKGREVAKRIYERHRVLTAAFISIGVSPETAAKDACKVEHDISEETFLAMKKYYNENIEK